eukprot:4150159-Pyramimonas_sp.AAC.1
MAAGPELAGAAGNRSHEARPALNRSPGSLPGPPGAVFHPDPFGTVQLAPETEKGKTPLRTQKL